MIRGTKLKVVASYLLLTFIFQIIFPTISFALTGGPSSPEVAGFTPVGNDNLVDLSTGDFSYSLPLMTVPGPNGGYPITMGYKSGITMEQEASWVGLGWDLNVGSINRSLRGLPDDFNGDVVKQQVNIEPNEIQTFTGKVNTAALILGKKEFVGLENDLSVESSIWFTTNNYLGPSFGLGTNYRILSFSSGFNFDSKNGISIPVGLSYPFLKYTRISLGGNFSTSQGFNSINFGIRPNTKLSVNFGTNYSFSKHAPIGEIPYEQSVNSYFGGAGVGLASNVIKYSEYGGLRYNTHTVLTDNSEKEINSYGYNYLENADEEDLMDFHKDGKESNYSPILPMPVLDYDVYSITGHGISGAFRAYRGDIPMLYPAKKETEKETIGGGAEFGLGDYLHLGADATFSDGGKGRTGKWGVNGDDDGQIGQAIEDDIQFITESTTRPLYKTFHFDFMGRQTQSNDELYANIQTTTPIVYDINKSHKHKVKGIKTKTPYIGASAWDKGIKANPSMARSKTTSHIAYKTKKELNQESNLKHRFIYNNTKDGDTISYNATSTAGHHINEISVTNTSGMQYNYGLPAYNVSKEEAYFAVDPAYSISSTKIDFDSGDASIDNDHGIDNFYKSTKTPAYVYSHLITSVLSSDYVDLKQDGPTEDDLGYWCKFQYEKVTGNYKWRAPFEGGNLIEGNHSNFADDKASFSHGEREQYYVKSIETKTHIAAFHLSERDDAVGSKHRIQPINGTDNLGAKSKRIDSIQLFSKEDFTTPVKTVHFEYDYSLCQGVPNNINGGGKLTLKKVWFTYQQNKKGELTPYEFEYGNGNPAGTPIDPVTGETLFGNPDYSYLSKTDRWGNYKSDPTNNSKFFPYSYQNDVTDDYVDAWTLTNIKLPSKGEIEIDYESDTYGYVQNKRAAQMYKIVGFSKGITPNDETNGNEIFEHREGGEMQPKKYLLFKKIDGSDFNTGEATETVKDIDYTYFKSHVNLKGSKNDYVEGYLKVKPSTVGVLSDNKTAYVEIKHEDYDDNQNKIHPIQKVACQHYHERQDLHTAVSSPIAQVKKYFGGPIKYYKNKKFYCAKQNNDNGAPISIIKLNNPFYNKYGGGSRVKSVKVNTGWGETYGTKYSYVLKDGKSSGVADYEPIIGGEENALKQPAGEYKNVFDYNSKKGTTQAFAEKPYAEAFYPAPIVRYSRVISESMTPDEVYPTSNETVSNLGGITVNEFYTSKDFPVYENRTIKDETSYEKKAVSIPFMGDIPYRKSDGFSQGFVTELNDMSGKPKKISTYDYNSKGALNEANIKTKVEYIYHTVDGNESRINADVKVLTQDGIFEDGNIGRKEEFYVYQQEDYDYDKTWTVSANAGFSGGVIPTYVTPYTLKNRSLSIRRQLVTNKVIYKTGILKEVITFDNGRQTISKNLAYDAQTGEALVQVQENDFNAPIYSYNYPGHWKYDALGGKYQNYRARFKVTLSNGEYYPHGHATGVGDFVRLGDVLRIEQSTNSVNIGKEVYVTDVNTELNRFTAKTINNQPVLLDNDIVSVVNSGYKNMQSTKVGSLVSTTNPMNWQMDNSDLITHIFNTNIVPCNFQLDNTNPNFKFYYNSNCQSLAYEFVNAVSNNNENILEVEVYNTNTGIPDYLEFLCDIKIEMPTEVNVCNANLGSLKKVNEILYTFEMEYNGATSIATITSNCDFACNIEGILHASTTELTEDLKYDYEDAGKPQVGTPVSSYDLLYNEQVYNPYAYGQKNIWRAKRSWVYQVDRKQSTTTGTEIDKDGEYETFKFFNWYVDSVANEKRGWTWTNQMTKYSPYGFDLENKNPLNIHSTEMYGSNHSTVIAKAANARNNEIAFENFETNNINGVHTLSGHFDNTSTVNVGLEAHTGNHSMRISLGEQYILNTASHLTLDANKKYLLSFWMYVRKSQGADVTISNTVSGASYIHNIYNSDLTVVDGWAKIDIPFTPQSTGAVSISFTGQASGSGFTAIDDIRIHPFNGSMNTYVYDSKTLKVTSELDHLNFSTLYNYDQEGGLVQVKKETEKGIFTVKTSRSNISH